MLNIKFRNVNLQAEDHTDLLIKDIKDVILILKEIFDLAESYFFNNPKDELCFSVTRLKGNDKLVVAYCPGATRNPYLFLLDKDGKTLSENIPIKKLIVLKNDIVKEVLKDNVLHIYDSKFRCIQTEELNKQIRKMSNNR